MKKSPSPQRRDPAWLLRRIAAADFSRGFQSTEGQLLVGSSRQRRLNSGVADATRLHDAPFPALKRQAKFSRRYAAKTTVVVLRCAIAVMLAAHFGQAQILSDLPKITFDNFGPGIREQVRKVDEAARRNPNDAGAVGRLAMVLQTYDDHELAAMVYQRARKLQPNEFQWIYLLAVCQAALGKHAEAAATFRESLAKKADCLPAQLRLADSLFALNELAESRKLYDAVIAKEPRTAQAFYGLGRVKGKLGDKSAIESFRKAVELSPSWGAAHYALALAYRDFGRDAGDTAKTAEHLQLSQQNKLVRPFLTDPLMSAVADLNSGAADRLRQGVALEAEGRLEDSIAEHRRALELNPQYLQVHINLIQLYGRMRQPDKAEEHYRAAIALNPTLAEAHYNFGVMLAEQKRQAEAAQAFRQAVEANPNFAEAHLNYGASLEAQQQYDEAMKHYRLAVESKPNLRQAHFQLARMLIFKQRLPEAIEHLQQTLLPEDAETPRFTYALAAAYARAGDKTNAVKFARVARDKAAAMKQTELLAQIERDLKVLEQEK